MIIGGCSFLSLFFTPEFSLFVTEFGVHRHSSTNGDSPTGIDKIETVLFTNAESRRESRSVVQLR